MATTSQIRVRGRPAHTSGPTHCSYTPDGTKLVTVGSNNTARVYHTGSDGEPANVDEIMENNLAVSSTNQFFVAGAEDGTVSKYNFDTMTFDHYLVRSSLPVRDVCISPDGRWCAVASDELVVKIVKTSDINTVLFLREQLKPVKHLSFDPSGKHIALSCTDGKAYFYALINDEPELIRTIDGLIRTADTDSEVNTKIVWHPDGRAFAAATATRDIQVMSRGDWENQRSFANGHTSDITALAWSPNGALLLSAGKEGLVLWDSATQKSIATYDYPNIMDVSWHPQKNLVSFTNSEADSTHLLKLPLQPAPFIHDPLSEVSANARRPAANGTKDVPHRGPRQRSPDNVSDILGSDIMGDEDDFVIDDDGAGPTVSCASWRDYVLTLGNGPVGADGYTKLVYTIQNIKRDEICQSEDIVALPDGETIKSVFFSDAGDPCIYDTTGTLLTLLHWRTPNQAVWVPLLDTKLLSRLASGRKTESYFPVAVAENKFHCIILKGGDQYPYFPRPLLSEFSFEIPVCPPDKSEDEDPAEGDELKKHERNFVLNSVLHAQHQDLIEFTQSTSAQRSALQRMELEIDKTEGEERGMRALEMVKLLRDRSGKMIEAAGKVADRYGRSVLSEKIREVGEEVLGGMDED
ncbi:putative Minichromosome loss protein 1 [Glarea lozoyensis 74030]|uniref:Putative Minichromosome loss protein 1 n=1 Tax=Glarea lozoyensis (strain ATCC 74030 / MF5533) TaxID=1104152 RepID=H0EG42_GLAL7|nr:putative Minichromosome loss protein 1 [Glarea lozoyensis 74030]